MSNPHAGAGTMSMNNPPMQDVSKAEGVAQAIDEIDNLENQLSVLFSDLTNRPVNPEKTSEVNVDRGRMSVVELLNCGPITIRTKLESCHKIVECLRAELL